MYLVSSSHGMAKPARGFKTRRVREPSERRRRYHLRKRHAFDARRESFQSGVKALLAKAHPFGDIIVTFERIYTVETAYKVTGYKVKSHIK